MNQPNGKPPRKVIQVFFLKNLLIWNGIFIAGITIIITLTTYFNTDWFINPILSGFFGHFFYNAWKSTGRKCWAYVDED